MEEKSGSIRPPKRVPPPFDPELAVAGNLQQQAELPPRKIARKAADCDDVFWSWAVPK